MALFVSEKDISTAWVRALEVLVASGGEAVNLTVAIEDPTREHPGVRRVLDDFLAEHRRAVPGSVERVTTVANTLFPSGWYIERLGVDAEEHLYELERTTRSVSRRRNRTGTYFERMVAWPGPKGGEFNQLDQVVRRLRTAREQGHERGNAYEVGMAMPTDAVAVPVQVPGKDRKTRGFPCLSHMSFSLHRGVVHLTALYRSHDFITRAYGNYVGLGQVLHFVARQSGLPSGELTCVSASANAETSRGKSFGLGKVRSLLDTCQAALETAP